MIFRRKLLAVFALTVFLSVAAVAFLVQEVTRRAFEKSEAERTAALVAQFRREFNRQGEDITRRVESIAASDAVSRMATSLTGTPTDSAGYFDLAKTLADARQLDFLDLVDGRGNIVSSAQAPARFGYPENGFENLAGASEQGAFLMQEELPESTALGLMAVRTTRVGENPIYVIGGKGSTGTSYLRSIYRPTCGRCCTRTGEIGSRASCFWIRHPGAARMVRIRLSVSRR